MATSKLIEIKTHEESFTDPEIKLRRKLESDLSDHLRSYTTSEALDSLKEYRATSDSFYPENHFYAFNGEDMIGFIHLWPQYSGDNNEDIDPVARLTLPFVRPGFEDAEEQLYQTVVKRAKELGVETLELSIWSDHQEMLSRAREYDYTYHDLDRLLSEMTVSELKIPSTDTYSIVEFKRDLHEKPVLELYNHAGYEDDQILGQFDFLEGIEDRIISWVVVEEDNEIIGHSVTFRYENRNAAQVTAVTRGKALSDEEYQNVVNDVFATHLSALENDGIETVELYLLNRVIDLRPVYEDLGFVFRQSDSYRQSI